MFVPVSVKTCKGYVFKSNLTDKLTKTCDFFFFFYHSTIVLYLFDDNPPPPPIDNHKVYYYTYGITLRYNKLLMKLYLYVLGLLEN